MKFKLVLPAVLLTIMVLALSPPTHGQDVGEAILAVSPQIIDVTVHRTFTVDIRIENLPTSMTSFKIHVSFDPDAMSVATTSGSRITGWNGVDMSTSGVSVDYGTIFIEGEGPAYREDTTWVTVTFHCKDAGTSTIEFQRDSWLHDGAEYIPIDFENSREGTITQRELAPAQALNYPITISENTDDYTFTVRGGCFDFGTPGVILTFKNKYDSPLTIEFIAEREATRLHNPQVSVVEPGSVVRIMVSRARDYSGNWYDFNRSDVIYFELIIRGIDGPHVYSDYVQIPPPTI